MKILRQPTAQENHPGNHSVTSIPALMTQCWNLQLRPEVTAQPS